MKQFIAIFALLGLLAAAPALAHETERDGTMSVELHVSPEDDPVIGQPAGLFFEFEDSAGKFKPTQCDCTVIVTQGKRIISSGHLFGTDNSDLMEAPGYAVTFPEKGNYEIKVAGKPKEAGSFAPFATQHDMSVTRLLGQPAREPDHSEHDIVYIVLVGLGIVASTVISAREMIRGKKKVAALAS